MSNIQKNLLFFLFVFLVKSDLPTSCSAAIQYFNEDYHCVRGNEKKIGEGANAIVFVVEKNLTNHKYALKISKLKENEDYSKNMNNIVVEKLKGQKYIIQRHGIKHVNNLIIEILDYAPNGDLLSYKSKWAVKNDQKKILELFEKIVEGIITMHKNRLIHADIKTDNVVVDPVGNPLIIDFDLTVPIDSIKPNRGTRGYVDPTILYNWGKGPTTYTEAIDAWALGVTLFKLIAGEFPFPIGYGDFSQMLKTVKKGDIRFPKGTAVCIVNIILNLLQYEQRNRVSLPTLLTKIEQIKKEPWQYLGEDLVYNIFEEKPDISHDNPQMQKHNKISSVIDNGSIIQNLKDKLRNRDKNQFKNANGPDNGHGRSEKFSEEEFSIFTFTNFIFIFLAAILSATIAFYCMRRDKVRRGESVSETEVNDDDMVKV